MKATQLPDRGVVKVAGDGARNFLNGLLTADMDKVAPGAPRYAALLTPQGKIIIDCIVAEAPAADGGGFFLDCPRDLAPRLVERLNFYKLRAKVVVEDLSEILGVLAAWGGPGTTNVGLSNPDPRLPALGLRIMLPPHLASQAMGELGADPVDPSSYEAHRIALAVPRGGLDFGYGDAFPHEADMDQLAGVDFQKGCYVGQEVVSRMEHRGRARTRVVPVAFEGPPPKSGATVQAGERQVGTIGSSASGRGLALLRLDRVDEALAAGLSLHAEGVPTQLGQKPEWARFPFPGEPGPGDQGKPMRSDA
jgi:folate-binding protein YgfZ